MYKNGFSSHYKFWEKPTQYYSNGFGISNHSNADDIFEDFYIVFFLMLLLAQYRPFKWRVFHLCLSFNHLTAISFNNICLFYVINRFWKGNGYFLKQIKNFFIKNYSPALIISLE